MVYGIMLNVFRLFFPLVSDFELVIIEPKKYHSNLSLHELTSIFAWKYYPRWEELAFFILAISNLDDQFLWVKIIEKVN